MGIFDGLKKLFGGTGGSGGGKRRGGGKDMGLYFYIRLDRSGEIVKIRLDPRHDLAPEYKEGTYFSNKAIIGPKSIERADATFYFDQNRAFDHADIQGGELSDEESYLQQQESTTGE